MFSANGDQAGTPPLSDRGGTFTVGDNITNI